LSDATTKLDHLVLPRIIAQNSKSCMVIIMKLSCFALFATVTSSTVAQVVKVSE
jgi:hypothetical protein